MAAMGGLIAGCRINQVRVTIIRETKKDYVKWQQSQVQTVKRS
jgi:hypothetical protein